MDYRNRKYYLIRFSNDTYEMRMKNIGLFAPSIKKHSPFNHFKKNKDEYDGFYTKSSRWNLMISCRKDESEALEYELRKAKRNDKFSDFLELDKNLLGQ